MFPSEVSLVAGQTRQLFASDQTGTVIPNSQVTWATSAPAVASLSTAGVLTGLTEGSASITATAQGKSGTAAVTVVSFTFASVAVGGAHTCALTTSGAAWCWGRGEFGQLGVAPPATTCSFETQALPCSLAPVAVQGGRSFTRLTAGGTHTCGLTGAGAAYCWGHNNAGQLGDNSTTNSFNDRQDAPVAVAGGLVFSALSAGPLHTCGITAAGAAHCWGANVRGGIGDGSTTNRPVPVPVTGGLTFVQITTGGLASGISCGLTGAGAAFCWGENLEGQLGIGTPDDVAHPAPVPVSGGISFSSLATGTSHNCGVTSAGSGSCRGANVLGSLGDGTMTQRAVPTPVSGGLSFTQIGGGGFSIVNAHTCGLSAGGQAHCWGDNEVGALGDGTQVNRLVPTPVTGQLSFSSIGAGLLHLRNRRHRHSVLLGLQRRRTARHQHDHQADGPNPGARTALSGLILKEG